MAFDAHKNFAYSLIAVVPQPALSGTSLQVHVGDGALFPAPPFNAVVWQTGVLPLAATAEVVRVTGLSSDTLTILRAQEGSAARAITTGDQIAASLTARTFTDIEGLVSSALQSGSNLGDLASASTARANLGLGTAATHAATDFDPIGSAAAAQTASDPAGSAAAVSSVAAAAAAAVVTETTRAEAAEALAAQRSSNLSDLADAGSARANIHVPVLASCAVVATANVTLSGAQTIDGVALVAGTDRVLPTAQTTASQNGPWVVQTGAWTRPTDFPTGQAIKARTVLVLAGTSNAGSTWSLSGATTIDSTSQTWTKLSSASLVADTLIPPSVGAVSSGLYLPRKYRASPPQPSSVLTTFQTGHGWTITTAASGFSISDDTTNFRVGAQAFKSHWANTSSGIFSSPDNLALNMTGKSLDILFQVVGRYGIAGSPTIGVTSDGTNYASAGFLNPGNDSVAEGEWQRLVIHQADFTGATVDWSNIRRIRFGQRVTSAAAPTDLWFNRIGLVPAPVAGPVISFTFDDSFAAAIVNYLPKLAQYGFPASCYLIADRLDDVTGTGGLRLTTAQAKELQTGHGWHMGVHADTQAHHDNTNMRTDAGGYATMESAFLRAKQFMVANGFNGVDDFAYGPYTNPGDAQTVALIRKHFRSGRTAYGGAARMESPIPPMPSSFMCKMFNSSTISDFETQIDKCVASKSWLVFLFHNISAGASTGLTPSQADFNTIVDYVATSGAKVKTVGQVLDEAAW